MDLIFGEPGFHWFVLRLRRCMFPTECSVSSASINISLSLSSNYLGWTASVGSIGYTFTRRLLTNGQIEPIEFRIRDIHNWSIWVMRWYWGITRRWIIWSVVPPATYQLEGVYERESVIFLTQILYKFIIVIYWCVYIKVHDTDWEIYHHGYYGGGGFGERGSEGLDTP